MGKYADIFDAQEGEDADPIWLDKAAFRGNKEAKAGKGGKYADIFDVPEASAREEAPSRPIENTGGDLVGQAKALSQRMANVPTSGDALYAGLRRGASFGFGDEVEAAGLRARDWITGRDARTPADLVAGRKAPTYADYRDAIRKRDAEAEAASPVAATVGELGGNVLSGLALPGGGLAKTGTSAAMQGFRQGALAGALAGAGNSEADLTKGDVGGLLRDTAVNAGISGVTGAAINKLVGNAPERVAQRQVQAIARGEEGGTAKASLVKKAMSKVGENGEDLEMVLSGAPKLDRALAVRAKSNPGAVAKIASREIDKLTPQTEPFYKAIDDQLGGVDLTPLAQRLDKAKAQALEAGRVAVAEAYDRAKARLVAKYGEEIMPGVMGLKTIPARSLRNMANELGEGLFSGEVSLPVRIKAQQQIYRDVVDSIADAGEKAGQDMAQLRLLNKKISTLIPVRDALADRALRAKAGHTTLGNALVGSGLIAAGAGAGGIEGAVAGAALDAGRRAAMPAGRAADYAMAQLVKAARAGSRPAQLGQMAIELGLGREIAAAISERGIGALSSPPPGEEQP